MTPNAERAGSARPAGLEVLKAALVAATLFWPATAWAGDRALIDYLGYSTDFRSFAFEEFGIQDGSGFAYSTIYLIDLDRDAWVAGTPVRVRAENEETPLADIRREALEQAGTVLGERGIAVPADVVAMIGDGVVENDGKSLEFGVPLYTPGSVSDVQTLRLATFGTEAASPCMDWFSAEPLGYELRIEGEAGERVVHRDAALPRSRGCPFDYRIHAVAMPFMAPGLEHAVALISVYPGGFEGPDRRFLAVPLAP